MSQSVEKVEVVSLGKYSLRSSKSGYQRLINFYLECKKHKNVCIRIDFSNLDWFDANLSAVLFSMIFILNSENGLTFEIDMKLIEEKFDILMRNGFIESGIVNEANTQSCVKLQGFDSQDETSFVSYITKDLFSNDGLKFMEEETKNRMIQNLLEVFANVSHARTEFPVFACGQYYPKDKRLKFTVVDLGVGFLEPIKEYTNGTIDEPQKAIKWALEEGATTKTNAPGGFGLYDIHTFCKESNSHLSILTNGVLWGTDNGRIEFYNMETIDGTVITLDFNCN